MATNGPSGETPIEVANRIAARYYERLEPGGDLYFKLEELVSEACAAAMDDIGVPDTPDGGPEPAATELFGNVEWTEDAIDPAIVNHLYRSTRAYLGEPVAFDA